MYVRMQVDPTGKKVNWFECKFGLETRSKGGSRYRSHGERMAVFYSPDGHEDSTEWTYMVTYGTRDEDSLPVGSAAPNHGLFNEP